MKVILENFGPIRRVEFDLSKDLNVIFGKNNIGKSYAITALYILLKHLLAEFGGDFEPHLQRLNKGRNRGFPSGFASPNFSEDEIPTSPLEEMVKNIRRTFQAMPDLERIDLSVPLIQLFREVFSGALDDGLTTSFSNSFESIDQLTNSRNQAALSMTVALTPFTLHFGVRGGKIVLENVQLHELITARESRFQPADADPENYNTLYFKAEISRREEQLNQIGNLWSILEWLLDDLRSHLGYITRELYFLPASRSGLYQALSTFGALFAELSKSRNFVTKSFSLPSISEPVADYFLRLSNIKPEVEQGEVSDIAHQMESQLLGGAVGFNEQTKKLYFKQDAAGQELEMDLSFASSMVSEIAPIIAHFKYILTREATYDFSGLTVEQIHRLPPSLIFIEEPEAHLHPEVQVKLMEFFARLTKHNVKVVMTSHSNYMFNKLSNLLLTDELQPEKVGSYLMRATPEGSVMDPFAMRAGEEGIADENFVDVAEQLYNERLQAYDKAGI